MRQEHVEPEKQVGHWSARMADGAIHSVTYDANSYGNLAHVVVRSNDYATPAYSASSYSAPSYAAPSYAAPSYAAPSYAAPSYATPSYSAPASVAPKMHYNYEEQNIYVPQTYAAPQTYAMPTY